MTCSLVDRRAVEKPQPDPGLPRYFRVILTPAALACTTPRSPGLSPTDIARPSWDDPGCVPQIEVTDLNFWHFPEGEMESRFEGAHARRHRRGGSSVHRGATCTSRLPPTTASVYGDNTNEIRTA